MIGVQQDRLILIPIYTLLETMKRLQLVCIALLFLLLTSCGVLSQTPPNQAIELAIAQQQTNIQQAIAQGLGTQAEAATKPNFKINQLNVKNRQKLSLPAAQQKRLPASLYKVRGTFEATLSTPEQTIRQENPFEVYLGTNDLDDNLENKSTEPEPTQTWYLIPPDSLKPPQ